MGIASIKLGARSRLLDPREAKAALLQRAGIATDMRFPLAASDQMDRERAAEAGRVALPGERAPVVRYVVPGEIVSTNMGYSPARWGKRIGFRLNDRGESFKERLLAAARRAWMDAGRPAALVQAAVAARLFFPTRGSDLDGPVKFVLDSLQAGGLVVNDNRVRRLVLEKPAPDGEPRIEIAVGPLGERCPHCGCACGSVKP